MAHKIKACKECKALYEGAKCPNCGSEEFAENHKGEVCILKPEESEVAKNLKLTKKSNYALKLG